MIDVELSLPFSSCLPTIFPSLQHVISCALSLFFNILSSHGAASVCMVIGSSIEAWVTFQDLHPGKNFTSLLQEARVASGFSARGGTSFMTGGDVEWLDITHVSYKQCSEFTCAMSMSWQQLMFHWRHLPLLALTIPPLLLPQRSPSLGGKGWCSIYIWALVGLCIWSWSLHACVWSWPWVHSFC